MNLRASRVIIRLMGGVQRHLQFVTKPKPLRDGDGKPWLSTIAELPRVTSLRLLKAIAQFLSPDP